MLKIVLCFFFFLLGKGKKCKKLRLWICIPLVLTPFQELLLRRKNIICMTACCQRWKTYCRKQLPLNSTCLPDNCTIKWIFLAHASDSLHCHELLWFVERCFDLKLSQWMKFSIDKCKGVHLGKKKKPQRIARRKMLPNRSKTLWLWHIVL